MSRGRHFRLQTTLPLDHVTSMNLSEEFRSPAVGGGRAQAQHRQIAGAERVAAGDTLASGPQRVKRTREGGTSARDGNRTVHVE